MPAPEQVALEAPLDAAFAPALRLIVGGIAERADFGFEAMDDLQLAIERLLVEAGHEGRVRLTFELREDGIRVWIGPLREAGMADALQHPERAPGTLTLRRILTTVVDSFGVEPLDGGDVIVRLDKLVARPA
ncbi:MAG: hypothetical protein ACR2GL_06265 [Thermoleophilaceae bacterium]